MYWLHLDGTQKKRGVQIRTAAEVQNPFTAQYDSLRWTALMITGDAELAEQSIIDATALTKTNSRAFRDWLVLWAHLATARKAIGSVRSAICEVAEKYPDCSSAHEDHEPLSLEQIRAFQAMDPKVVVEQLDVLARAVLMIHGCHGASFEDCVFLLGVPLHAAIGAYCRAKDWCKALMPAENIQTTDLSQISPFLLPRRWTFGM